VASIPYTPQPTAIPRFLKHIQAAGVPAKVTQQYLATVGFKSTNDLTLIPILKTIHFLDASGAPTQQWRDYRNTTRARSVLGSAIRASYSDLFAVYPDADRRDAEALRNFFGSHTDLSGSTLDLAVRTFRTLCADAEFPSGDQPASLPHAEVPSAESPRRGAPDAVPVQIKHAPVLQSVNLNIQLQLPATDDASVYEKLFAAMRKHLLDRD